MLSRISAVFNLTSAPAHPCPIPSSARLRRWPRGPVHCRDGPIEIPAPFASHHGSIAVGARGTAPRPIEPRACPIDHRALSDCSPCLPDSVIRTACGGAPFHCRDGPIEIPAPFASHHGSIAVGARGTAPRPIEPRACPIDHRALSD
jgi:hypothetical protein